MNGKESAYGLVTEAIDDRFVREAGDESKLKAVRVRKKRMTIILSAAAAVVFILLAVFSCAEEERREYWDLKINKTKAAIREDAKLMADEPERFETVKDIWESVFEKKEFSAKVSEFPDYSQSFYTDVQLYDTPASSRSVVSSHSCPGQVREEIDKFIDNFGSYEKDDLSSEPAGVFSGLTYRNFRNSKTIYLFLLSDVYGWLEFEFTVAPGGDVMASVWRVEYNDNENPFLLWPKVYEKIGTVFLPSGVDLGIDMDLFEAQMKIYQWNKKFYD